MANDKNLHLDVISPTKDTEPAANSCKAILNIYKILF